MEPIAKLGTPRLPLRHLSRPRSYGPVIGLAMSLAMAPLAHASQAYGSINNFDSVNDTGVPAHGFEIEIDYGHTRDITYTYDYNHYGTPHITEDNSDPVHPRVFVRYESKKNADGSWAAYTAVPTAPISPTQGHQFTNPAVNFGGEHFGVGFMGTPAAVKYAWLVDDGSGNLIKGAPVYIATPSFTYAPPVNAKPAAVVAAIQPPPPPVLPPLQFGVASWVKEIKTKTRNPNKVKLEQLVGDDPGKPQPWANGEQPEVEMEWALLQTEFAKAGGGKNGELKGKAEDLPGGNEVITRRYEFYKYIGPVDAETGEAMAPDIAPDGKHGIGMATYADHFDNATGEWVTKTVDLSKIVIVGDFFGTQMAGFDVAPQLGLIEHLQDSDAGVLYPERRVVVPGAAAFSVTLKSGSLPPGLHLNSVSGTVSGTPTTNGIYTFTLEAADLSGALISKAYTVNIGNVGLNAGPFNVSVSASPATDGTVKGGGVNIPLGTLTNVTAAAKPGYYFVNWTESGTDFATTAAYSFNVDANHDLVANFLKYVSINTSAAPAEYGIAKGAGAKYKVGANVTLAAVPNAGFYFVNWTEAGTEIANTAGYRFPAASDRSFVANFAKYITVNAAVAPASTGTTSGSSAKYKLGQTVTLASAPATGYYFVNWTENGTSVGLVSKYIFSANVDRTLTANFLPYLAVDATASPALGGVVKGYGTKFKAGQTVTLRAAPNLGYKFLNWTENGTVVSTATTYTFAASANRTLVANFALK